MSFDQFTCHKMFDKYDLMAAAEYDKHNTRVCRYRDLSRQRAIDAVVCNPPVQMRKRVLLQRGDCEG